jgi:hypothetical protein
VVALLGVDGGVINQTNAFPAQLIGGQEILLGIVADVNIGGSAVISHDG